MDNPTTQSVSESMGVGVAISPINNPKSLTIGQVENGFTVNMQRVETYGQDWLVAKTVGELQAMVAQYFA